MADDRDDVTENDDFEDINYDHIPDVTIDEETGDEIRATTIRVDQYGRIIEEPDMGEGAGKGEPEEPEEPPAPPEPPNEDNNEEQPPEPDPPQERARLNLTPFPSVDSIPRATYPPERDYDTFNKEYPPIREVQELTDLEITPDMYPSNEGFLPRYLEWSRGTVDSPDAFHLASALSAVAFSLGRNYKAEFRHILPNVMILLVGGSGDRKSSAMGLAKNLLPQDQVHAGSLSSSGAFMQKLQSNPVMFWYVDEADTFFQVVSTQHNTVTADMAARIATTFTGERSTYESLMQGNITVEEPCFSVLMGSALSWLKQRKLSAAFLRGGLFARMWIVPAKRTRLLSFPPPPNKGTQEAIREWLSGLRGTDETIIPFSHGAKAELSAYQRNALAPPILKDCGVWNRSQAHIVKLSMLYHVCKGRNPEQEIERSTVQTAINFVHNFLMPGYLWFTRKLEAVNEPVMEREQEILETLEAAGTYGMKVVQLQASYGRRINANEAIINLYRRGLISIYKDVAHGHGRHPFYAVLSPYKVPDHYMDDGALPAFIQKVIEMEE